MSKIKNGGLDQYDAEPFEQQQFGTAGVEGVNSDERLTAGWNRLCGLCVSRKPLLTRECFMSAYTLEHTR